MYEYSTPHAKKIRFNLELLKNEENRNKYQYIVDRNLVATTENENRSVHEIWNRLQSSMMNPTEVLKITGSPPTPRRSKGAKKASRQIKSIWLTGAIQF